MTETYRNIPDNSDKDKSFAEARQRVFDAAIDLLEKYPISGPGNKNKMKTSYAKLQEIISLVLQNPEPLQKDPDILEILEEELKFENKILSNFVTRVFKSDEWIQLVHLFPGTSENDFFTAADIFYQENHGEEKLSYSDFFNLIKNALPYIPDVLDACRKETGLQEITFVQFIQNEDPATGKPAESLYEKCLRRNPPVLKSIIPDQYKIANSLICNSMTAKDFVNGGLLSLDPSKGHSGKYHIYAAITLDPNKYAVDGTFTKYDRRVFNGYCTLIEAGNPVFTAEMVYRAMNGLSNSEFVSPNQIAAVTKSLNKQRDIDIKIDATEEFKKRGLIEDNSKTTAVFEAKCLESRKVIVKVAGREKTAYQILSKPVLYEYSEKLNQIISIPSELLTVKDETGGRISNTDNFTAIREYLLMRIEEKRNAGKYGNKPAVTIDINTFYSETDTNTATTKATTKAREQARLCLEYWKSISYISRYEFVKQNPKSKNSSVTKIIIHL